MDGFRPSSCSAGRTNLGRRYSNPSSSTTFILCHVCCFLLPFILRRKRRRGRRKTKEKENSTSGKSWSRQGGNQHPGRRGW
jgi:hypothetical protein